MSISHSEIKTERLQGTVTTHQKNIERLTAKIDAILSEFSLSTEHKVAMTMLDE